jgi:olfactory receptor
LLLLGISEDPGLQPVIFGLFLSMYLLTVLCILLIILARISDSYLHMTMYFFLSSLSCVDICVTSIIIPKMLANIQREHKTITYKACITQMKIFAMFDIILLTAMAYDLYMAICHPLHYPVIMNPWFCVLLVLVSWLVSQLYYILKLFFCVQSQIPHFFCELNHVVQLTCYGKFFYNVVTYFGAVILCGSPFTGILYFTPR